MKKVLIFILFLSIFCLSSCSKSKEITKTIYIFDTTVNINLYEGNSDNLNDIVDMLYSLHKLTDQYNSYTGITNIHSINESIKAGTRSFDLDDDLKELLVLPERFDQVNAYMNVEYSKYILLGIGELTNLWKTTINTKVLPDAAKLQEIKEDIENGYYDYDVDCQASKLTLSENTKVQFDLGSIVKGYASSKVRKYLDDNNITKYLIDFGQSTILLGEKNNNKGFNVLVNGTAYIIKDVKNSFLGTASILERNVTINNKVYHHIINPLTCYPTETYDSVVVRFEKGYMDYTDLLSTYLMINPDGASDVLKAYGVQHNVHIYFFKDGGLVKEVGEV